VIEQLHPTQVQEKIQAGEPVYFLDVREYWEHQHCAIGESQLIPLGELPQRVEEVTPPEGCLVVVYCHHGVRSLSGAAILQQHGFKNVASLWGGIELWSRLVDPSVPRY
jgi:rhodanese-related sulfurtransferase